MVNKVLSYYKNMISSKDFIKTECKSKKGRIKTVAAIAAPVIALIGTVLISAIVITVSIVLIKKAKALKLAGNLNKSISNMQVSDVNFIMDQKILDQNLVSFWNNIDGSYGFECGNFLERLQSAEEIRAWLTDPKNQPIINRITHISSNLSLSNKFYMLPPEICYFSNLQALDLSRNVGSLSFLPKEISGLNKLVYLNLSNNNFSSFPLEICELKSLVSLHFYNNKLSSFPIEMSKMSSLRNLFFDYNSFSSFPTVLESLSLREISFDVNPFVYVDNSYQILESIANRMGLNKNIVIRPFRTLINGFTSGPGKIIYDLDH